MKRTPSGLSLIVGVNKPRGMTSHDVVNTCRRIFGERRVGHVGTLDPLATGVLLLCVGPATRLESYLVGHEKTYRVRIAFGAGTDTDDADGSVIRQGHAPAKLSDESFARSFLAGMIGTTSQLPPAYSAVKVAGKKSYEAARAGVIIDLKPRVIEVLSAHLNEITSEVMTLRSEQGTFEQECLIWDVTFRVSKGTYIRSLARDMGSALSCPAHVATLERLQVGNATIDDCVSLDTLSEIGKACALDPVLLLEKRFIYADDAMAERIGHGQEIPGASCALFEYNSRRPYDEFCACTSGVCESKRPAEDGELIAVLHKNTLIALDAYSLEKQAYVARCVFQTGVIRGADI